MSSREALMMLGVFIATVAVILSLLILVGGRP
jgi:hypothetical protein